MILAQVLSPYSGDGSDSNPNHPQLADDYPLRSWVDITGAPAENIPTDVPLLAIEITAEDDVVQSIELDDTYFVLWSTPIGGLL